MCGNLFLDRATTRGWLTRTAARWEEIVYTSVRAAVAVLLGASSLFGVEKQIWSANSILLAAVAFAFLAYRRKAEACSPIATLFVMLAGVLITTHFDRQNPFLALRLVQVCLAVVGVTALVRLAAHRFIAKDDVEVRHLIHLPAQLALGIGANVFVMGIGLAELVVTPANPDDMLPRIGDLSGWIALASNLAAAVWYLAVVRPRFVVHGVALGSLMLGVVIAGSFTAFFPTEDWLGHHLLTLTWTLAGLALLVAPWTSHVQPALGPQWWPAERREGLADFLRRCLPESWARLGHGVRAFVVLLAVASFRSSPIG